MPGPFNMPKRCSWPETRSAQHSKYHRSSEELSQINQAQSANIKTINYSYGATDSLPGLEKQRMRAAF